jgi:hypothetical protein
MTTYQQLQEIHSVLDRALGDSDIDWFESDEEMRDEEPVQWATMRLALVLEEMANEAKSGTAREVEG